MNSLLRVGNGAFKATISRGFATAAFPDRKVTVLGAAGDWFGLLPDLVGLGCTPGLHPTAGLRGVWHGLALGVFAMQMCLFQGLCARVGGSRAVTRCSPDPHALLVINCRRHWSTPGPAPQGEKSNWLRWHVAVWGGI